jgi:uncharacterized protein (TIGR00375 family)
MDEEKGARGVIADLHIHSRFSRACSKSITIENLVKYAKIKGVNLLGTGDFTHPLWLKEIKEKLIGKNGLYYFGDFPFVLSGEVSLMYTQVKGRRIHLVVLSPSLEIVDKINSYLDTKGRRDYDGRPIFNIPADEFVKEMIKISTDIEIIPAHCLPGDSMIPTKDSIKKIKDVREGDLVLTHKNRWKKVTEVFVRDYFGKTFIIRPWYFTEGLETTPEHPYFAIRSYKCSWIKGLCKKNCSKLDECKNKRFEKYLLEWVPASELKKGDFLAYPRFNKINDINKFDNFEITADFCRLLGYFLAEGYLIRKEGLGFSFNRNEKEYVSDVITLMKKVFGKAKFKLDDRKGRDIIFYSKSINAFFSHFYNSKIHRAHTKIVKSFMLELPLNKQIELFRGWYRGDKGYTISRELMNQMKIICLRLGIIPNISVDRVEKHNKRGKHFIGSRKILSNYDLYSLGNLSFFEDKFCLLEEGIFKKFKTKMSRRHGWIDKNYIYIPIRQIEVRKYRGQVYNLEVEQDNSYSSEFACVHNCWTPWFGIFGSKSGFDSLKEAFKEQFENIHAIETGMSSDPEMNWRISELNDKAIISFSDSHSFWPWRIGREATIFNKIESYEDLIKEIREKSYKGTIETDPGYGIYHWDGHRDCGFSSPPEKTKELNGICPVCGKPLTIGVENRVEELTNQRTEENPNRKKYYKLLPLHEIIALAKASTLASKKTWQVYNLLIEKFGNEFNILLNVDKKELARFLPNDTLLVELIMQNREGKIKVKPGYDGVYGEAQLSEMQKKLF